MTKQQAYALLKISNDILPAGSPNRSGSALKARFITIHNTDNTDKGANARRHAAYMKGEDAQKRKVSWHFTVDDKETIKHLPMSEQGWHAGTREGNESSIGIEICMNSDGDQKEANDRAALLAALLVVEFGLEIGAVVPHKHWSGKNCPRLLLKPASAWSNFIKQVATYIAQLTDSNSSHPVRGATALLKTAVPPDRGYTKFRAEIQSSFAPMSENQSAFAATGRIILPGGESYVLNALPDVPDFRDQYFVATLIQVPSERPLSVYLGSNATILNQGQEGACTGFGLAAVANYLLRQAKNRKTHPVSPRMLYEMARRYDEWPGEAYSGSSARGAMKGWNKHGVCTEAQWPYTVSNPGTLTTARAVLAAENPLGAYFRVNHKDIVAMHAAISEVGILYATAQVHEGWQTVQKDGVIVYSPTVIGGHAFAIVGYDRNGFWIQNSWGVGWGKQGYAHISYDDWLQNGSDVWVARLGVPISFSTSSGATLASNFLTGDVKPVTYAQLRPHVVCLDNDGLLAQTGAFANDQQSVSDILNDDFKRITQGWAKKRILVYAHGGLVEESGFLNVLSNYRETMLANEVYPICFVWRTGILDTIRQILEDVSHQRLPMESFGSWLDERKDDLIEVFASLPGRLTWSQMKSNAIQATTSRDGGARLVANLLAARLKDEDVEIHIAGHSAGSILLAPFVQLLASKGPIRTGPMRAVSDSASRLIKGSYDGLGLGIASCTLWAPAIRTDLFDETYAPLMRNRSINRLAIYGLTDKAERDDNCLGIYGKSLLYLVSRSFEAVRNAPILGMERYQSPDLLKLPRTEIVKSRYDLDFTFAPGFTIPNTASESRHHGDYDDDPATLWSTLARILDMQRVSIL